METNYLYEILRRSSAKKEIVAISHWVGNDEARFAELIGFYCSTKEPLIAFRAAWAASFITEKQPQMVVPHLRLLLYFVLETPNLHDAQKRNMVRILRDLPELPVELEGEILELCLRALATPKEPLSVKGFSMAVLERIIPKYPEIIPEVRAIIEQEYDHQSSGFRFRAKRLFALFNSLL